MPPVDMHNIQISLHLGMIHTEKSATKCSTAIANVSNQPRHIALNSKGPMDVIYMHVCVSNHNLQRLSDLASACLACICQ